MAKKPTGKRGNPAEGSDLSRLYRAGTAEQPPAHLDAAILAEARKAVRAPSRLHNPFGAQWTVPLSAAAVVVVSVALVVFMTREGVAPWRTQEPESIALTDTMAVTSSKAEAPAAAERKSDELRAKMSSPPSQRAEEAPVITDSAALKKSAPAPMTATSAVAARERSAALPESRGMAAEAESNTARTFAKQAPSASAPSMPVVNLKVGGRVIRAEVATTTEQRMRGLMFRERLVPDAGMLFVFESNEDRDLCFWMRNTLIPLSAAFIDETGKVLNIEDMQPLTETMHCAAGRARFVLELNQGAFVAAGVRPGTRIEGLPGLR